MELLISIRSWEEYEVVALVFAEFYGAAELCSESGPSVRLNQPGEIQDSHGMGHTYRHPVDLHAPEMPGHQAAGVIIDFKEPDGGPLAPASPHLWCRVADQFNNGLLYPAWHAGVRLSAALGDAESAIRLAREVPRGFSFAKMGPEGIADPMLLGQRWSEVANGLPDSVSLVPVAYADHRNAGSPSVSQVIGQCVRDGYTRLLIDTFDKSGPSSIACFDADRKTGNHWDAIREQIAEDQLWLSLAGKIDLAVAERLTQGNRSPPDCIGIRGALCQGSRSGTINADRLREWLKWRAKLLPRQSIWE